ncbi:MAG TPA: peptidoglycan-binding protein LysM, partial [Ignavibacteriales bacterium]|nr:peptidoglycan-binding protein LysM [Ignavibacteriales bacterium]
MEIKKYLISFFAILFLLSVTVIAQEEMTTDEWEAEMTRLKDKKESLTKEISVLQNEVNNLKATKLQSYEDCVNELYAMVGGTKADVDNYRKAVTELDGKIRRKEGPKVDRQKDLDALKMNKISALPEFFDKVHNQMQR